MDFLRKNLLVSNFLVVLLIYDVLGSPNIDGRSDRVGFYGYVPGRGLKRGYIERNKRLFMLEPVVVNGKIVPRKMVEKMMDDEIRPPEDSSRSSLQIFHKNEFVRDEPKSPPICFQIIKHRNLQHSSFYTMDRPVTRNECRCACARTWMTSSKIDVKCLSLHYNPISKSCSLNSANHMGKYDLVLDLFSEYHYVSCEPEWLLQIAEYKCQITPLFPTKSPQKLEQSKRQKPEQDFVEPTKTLANSVIELVPPQDAMDGPPPLLAPPKNFRKLLQALRENMKMKSGKNMTDDFMDDLLESLHKNGTSGQTKEDMKEREEIFNMEYETGRLFNESITPEDVDKRIKSTYKAKQLLFYMAGLHPEVSPPDDGTFAHDILLTEDQSNSLIDELKNIISGKDKRNSIFFEKLPEQKWEKFDAIPFTIDPRISQNESLIIFNAIRQIESKTCLRFMYSKTKPEGHHIYYTKFRSATRCGVSYVGKIDPVNPIYFTFNCPNFTAIVIHETMHALGVHHQHMRPDRDNYIDILWHNVNPRNYDYFVAVTNKNFTSYGIPYDYGSLLHYGPYTGAINKTTPTMIPRINPKVNFKRMGQKRGPSWTDIDLLNKMYCLNTSCVDKSVYCGAWALINSCTTNVWMQKNCKKSCDLCK